MTKGRNQSPDLEVEDICLRCLTYGCMGCGIPYFEIILREGKYDSDGKATSPSEEGS